MTELLRNAASGWANYKGSGKMAALLLAALAYLWFTGRGKGQKALLLYASLAAACCVLPVTAAVLMAYQTKFYDYEWIWSMVPLTAVTAYGAALFLAQQWKKDAGGWRRGLPVTLLLLLALGLCGNLGGDAGARAERRAEREEACAVAGMLAERYPGEDICLLAPQAILEYAREADGRLRLAYGRNMWDISLNGYAYDTYDKKTVNLYRWMGWAEQSAGVWMPEEDREEMLATVERRAEDAVELGVNCILLPAGVPGEIRERMEAALGTRAEEMGDYIVFALF